MTTEEAKKEIKTENKVSKKRQKIINILLDPLTIYSLLTFINFLTLIILFFKYPIIEEYIEIDGTIKEIYWNGFYNIYNSTTLAHLGSDFTVNYPKGASILFLVSIISMLICTIAQLLTITLKSNFTRKKFLSIYTWPTFIFSALIMISVFTVVNWNYILLPRMNDDILAKSLVPIKYGIFLSVLLTLLSIVSATILSKGRRKV